MVLKVNYKKFKFERGNQVMRARVIGLTIIAMFLVVLAACGNSNAETQSKDNATGTKSETSNAKGSGTAPDSANSKPVKVSVFVEGDVYPPEGGDVILEQFNELLNMDLDFQVGGTDYGTMLNVRIAGGTPPDIFTTTKSRLNEFAKQDALLDLEPYLDKLPNAMKQINALANIDEGRVNGKLVGLPKANYLPSHMMFIRQDWLDELGLEVPTTLEELRTVALAFTNDDPDGNNQKDTYGITGLENFSSFDPIFSAFGIGRMGLFSITDNNLVYSSTHPFMKDALAYLKDLQDNGALDSEFTVNKGTKHQENAFKGQAGIVYMHWAQMSNNKQQILDINPDARWTYIETLTGPGGTYNGAYGQGTSHFVSLSKSLEKDPERLEKALEYLDFITHGEGQLISYFGKEGENFTLNGDQVELLPEGRQTAYAFMHQLLGRDDRAYLPIKFPNDVEVINSAINVPRVALYNSLIPIPEEVTVSDIQRYELEEAIAFIYGRKSLDEFEQFVDTLNNTYKLPLYIQSGEAALKDLGILK